MAVGGLQHFPDRTVGRNLIRHRPRGFHQIAAVLIRMKLAAHVHSLERGILHIVQAVRGGLPDVEFSPFDRIAVQIEHASVAITNFTAAIRANNAVAICFLRRAFAMKRAKHGRFGSARRFAITNKVGHHGDAHGVGEEDKLLAAVVAHVAGLGEEIDSLPPFCLGELHVLQERVDVFDETLHDLFQARILGAVKAAEHFRGNVVFGGRAWF